MAIFTLKDRQAAEASSAYALLADGLFGRRGRVYRLRGGADCFSLSERLRINGLISRYMLSDGRRVRRAYLLAMAELAFDEPVPQGALERCKDRDLEAFVAASLKDDKKGPEPKDSTDDADVGHSVMRVADRYKVAPLEVWDKWPVWMLRAAIEGLPRVESVESISLAEAMAVGAGRMDKRRRRRTQQRWHREASPRPVSTSRVMKASGFFGMFGARAPARRAVTPDRALAANEARQERMLANWRELHPDKPAPAWLTGEG